MGARLGEAQTGGALACPLNRTVDVLKGILSEDAVVTQAFHVPEPTVCAEADFAQLWQVEQSLADAEVVGVVDRGFGAQARFSL